MFSDILTKTRVQWAGVNPIELKNISCLFCGSSKNVVGKFNVNGYDLYILSCKKDGLFWQSPQLGKTFLDSLYSPEYYSADQHGADILQVGTKELTEADKTRRIETARKQLAELKAEGILGKRVLEVGSLRKDFIHEAGKEYDCEISLLEVSAQGVHEATLKEIPVMPQPLERTQSLPQQYFDLAVMYDFFEHTTNPRKTLRVLSSGLKQGGYFAIRVPDTKKVPRLHLVDHLWHFSQPALEKLLEQEGLTVFKSFPSGVFPANPTGDNKIEHRTYFARKWK